MSEATIYNWLEQERSIAARSKDPPPTKPWSSRREATNQQLETELAVARKIKGCRSSAMSRRRRLERSGRVAVIELIAVDVVHLADADLRLAVEEGEGFESVAEWREAHERFWNDEVLPTLPVHLVAPLTDETLVVVERFRLLANKSA